VREVDEWFAEGGVKMGATTQLTQHLSRITPMGKALSFGSAGFAALAALHLPVDITAGDANNAATNSTLILAGLGGMYVGSQMKKSLWPRLSKPAGFWDTVVIVGTFAACIPLAFIAYRTPHYRDALQTAWDAMALLLVSGARVRELAQPATLTRAPVRKGNIDIHYGS
jgi:hypothetical protein